MAVGALEENDHENSPDLARQFPRGACVDYR